MRSTLHVLPAADLGTRCRAGRPNPPVSANVLSQNASLDGLGTGKLVMAASYC